MQTLFLLLKFIALTFLAINMVSASSSISAGCSEVLEKAPWEMTREEWVANGSPDYNINWNIFWSSLEIEDFQKRPWKKGVIEEIHAINSFMSLFKDPIGEFRKGYFVSPPYIPGQNVARERQEDFAKIAKHQFTSALRELRIEDAREAIIVGRKMGYHDRDILFYIIRNYIFCVFVRDRMDLIYDHINKWHKDNSHDIIDGTPIPEHVKKLFPPLKPYSTF